jgi:signal transduction histidine kinase/CheY-like chemotaxis protein
VVQHFCTIFQQTLEDYYLIEKQSLAQSLAVEVGRQAQNETLLDIKASNKAQRNLDVMGNADLDTNIFNNAASYLQEILQADGCAIFNLSEFRLTIASTGRTQSQGSSNNKDFAKLGLGDIEDLDSNDVAAASTETTDDVSDLTSPLQSNDSSVNTSQSQFSTFKEHFIASGEGKTHCSFFSSPAPVRILGHSGRFIEHFQQLSGNLSRPVIGRYLSMTRSSGLNSKAFIESTSKKEYGLSVLAPSESKTTICCSVAEADTQPAFLIFAYFTREEVQFDRTEELFIEQLGAYLIYSSIRSRVIAVDRAQMRFTQRIQHELRTPLHAIIGVNEMAKQNLHRPFTLDELKEMNDAIGISADSLNLLVDDLVDFSLMERLGGERKLTQMGLPPASWDEICGSITSTSLQAFTLCQRLENAGRQDGPPPPPELSVYVEDMYKFDWSTYKTPIDLEAIRRIVWKLVMNAIQATTKGIITITISYKPFLEKDKAKPVASINRLQITVQDTGKGMEQSFIDNKLFHPFGKEDEESGGVGLSLSICQQLAAQLSGRLYAESQIGKGTKMVVSLPLVNAEKLVPKLARQEKRPLIAFLGFDTPSKRLFVEGIVKQFSCKETADLKVAPFVVVSVEDADLQTGQAKIKKSLSDVQPSAHIIFMPGDAEEDRIDRLEELEASIEQHTHIFERPMSFAIVQEFSQLLESTDVEKIEAVNSVSKATSAALASHIRPTERKVPSLRESASNSSIRTEGQDSPGFNIDLHLSHVFTVLVVDDNPLNARIMTAMLKRAKVDFRVAGNGKEAVEMFTEHLPALVLLDINMPIMNGFDACVEMRKVASPYNHRIVAVTALSTEAERRRGKECGMDDWLTKPTRMLPLMRDLKRESRRDSHLRLRRREERDGRLTPFASFPARMEAAIRGQR